MSEKKWCNDCREDRPVSDFYKGGTKCGLSVYCKLHTRLRFYDYSTKRKLRDAIYILRMRERRA